MAAKVTGSARALEALCRAAGLDPGGEPGRVHLVGRRREDDIDAELGRERGVPVEVARVGAQIRGLGELRRVHEDARDEHITVGTGRCEERGVPGVQGAHRRDETDDPVAWQVELGDRAHDDHGRVASASAS